MSERQRDAGRLDAELAQLRAALRSVQAPPVNEAALRARFRGAAQQRALAAAAAKTAGSSRMHLAAAAVVVLAIGAVFVTVLKRVERPAQPVAAEAPQQIAPLAAAAFQPLSNAPAWSPALSYSVVRVRIPLSAFAIVPGTQQDGTVEAELLVGEDGLARGIRFAGADTMLVSVAAQ
jgi:hypothetical protein